MKSLFEQYLRGFEMLQEDEISLLIKNTDVKSFKKGDILIREGQIAKNCYLVLQGAVREYHLKNGEEKSTAFYLEGDSVTAYTSHSKNEPASRYLECIEDCVLTVGNDGVQEEMCQLIPRLKSIIMNEMERICGVIQDDLATFMTSSAEERYKDLSLNKPDLLKRIPQHQIASYIGITPESLSRIRKRLTER